MTTILILGGSGQVGYELQRSLAPLGEILAPDRETLDLMEADSLDEYLYREKPDMIVNAAAWTNVDDAEAEEHQLAVTRLNVGVPTQLATFADYRDIPLIHYSTDYVYAGDGSEALDEHSPTAPASRYGESKLAGDLAVLESGRHLVLRTSWVYAARGKNFLNTMLRVGAEREALKIVDDQVGAPTSARLIADMTLLAAQALKSRRIRAGVYHLASRGETSWYGFAYQIFQSVSEGGMELSVDLGQVKPIPTSEYPTTAARPLNSRLDVRRLEQTLGVQLPGWESQLALVLQERLKG